MMDLTDHGVIVVCGEWDDVNRYIISNGLDPAKVVKPHGATFGLALKSEQVIMLIDWRPDPETAEWFWTCVAQRSIDTDEVTALIDRARDVTGLLPEHWQ